MLDSNQLKQKVKTDSLPALIAVGGKEKSLQEDLIKFIRDDFLQKPNGEMNWQRVDFIEKNFDGVIQALQTMPFLASKRLVEISNAEKLTDENLEDIKKYMENPSPTSFLLISFDKFDKRNKAVNFFTKLNILYEFNELNEKDLIGRIMSEAALCGLILDEGIADFISKDFEGDFLSIKAFFAKISILFQGQLEIEQIVPYLSNNASLDVFLLVRNISEGNLEKSLILLNKLRDTKENALKFLGLLVWQFRVLVHIRDCFDEQMSDWDIRKAVSIYGDRYDWMSKIARKKSIDFHMNRLTRLIKVDEALKSINAADSFIFIEKAVYQSCIGL